MPSNIILKKSSVANKIPLATDLQFGELALNYADGKLFYKKADGTTIDFFGNIIVQDEGSNLTTSLGTLNFTGAGVTASNSGGVVTINIAGGGGGGSSGFEQTFLLMGA